MSMSDTSVTITIEGAGFTMSDAYPVTDAALAREAARRIAHYAMTQLGGPRRKREEAATPQIAK